MAGDIFSVGKPKLLKFTAILILALFSTGAGKEKSDRCITAVFFFTVIADIFFLLLNKPLYGIGVYIIIQSIHALRLSFISEKKTASELFKRLIPALVLAIAGLTLKGPGLALISAYAVFISVNIAHCIENYIGNKNKNNLLYLIGMVLLVIGDIGVGLRNLQLDFLTAEMANIAYIITWITYLPSLMIILSTTEAFCIKNKKKH